MTESASVLIVDDTPASARLLADLLSAQGYATRTAADGAAALAEVERAVPDLILLDLMMPGIDGVEVCRRLRAQPRHAALPILIVSAADERAQRLRALEAGADDFVAKPVDRAELSARVRAHLRGKRLHDTVAAQAQQLADWSRTLEARVAAQVGEIERLSLLKRFLPARLAQRVLEQGEGALASHRREIVVLFADLRGFTAFAETAAPEEVLQLLGEFHAALGRRVEAAEGTLERFTGDGAMVFFNDPLPVPDAAARALRLALALQGDCTALRTAWQPRGYDCGLGIGIAQGYATLGAIGFAGRVDYAAIGAVTNLAQRLCAAAAAGQVLAARRVLSGCETSFDCAPLPAPALPGIVRPVEVVQVRALREPA